MQDKDPAAASGVVDDPAGAVDLEPGRAHVFCAWVHADRAGSIRVSCRLQYRAAGLVSTRPGPHVEPVKAPLEICPFVCMLEQLLR